MAKEKELKNKADNAPEIEAPKSVPPESTPKDTPKKENTKSLTLLFDNGVVSIDKITARINGIKPDYNLKQHYRQYDALTRAIDRVKNTLIK